jgi:biopolymer transport protein ExbD
MTSLILAPVFDVHDGMHRLELTPADEVLIDGVAVDLVGLRQRLDMIAVSTSAWVDFRPHAHARYELFAEVLAVLKRARIERLRLDGRAFVHAIDRHG